MKGSFLAFLGGWSAKFAMVAVMAALLLPGRAVAQDSRKQEFRPGPAAGQPRAQPSGQAQPQGAGDSGQVEKRLERVEEQLIDMQSMIGAVESIAKSGGGGGGGGAGGAGGQDTGAEGGNGGGDVASRVQGLEMQLRALSSQMNEILDRLSRLDGQSGAPAPRGGRQGALDSQPPSRPSTGRAPEQQTGFGGTSIEPAESDSGDNSVAVGPAAQPRAGGDAYGRDPGASDSGRGQRFSSTAPSEAPEPARSSSPEAHRLYDQAYGMLVARDFQGATDGFTEFLQRHGNDPLAGAAQYWLGQASFELGEYRKAADMFLKGYTNYPRSEKAPESLLKLGIALKRLNEKNAACDSFAEFGRRFPQAPQALQQRAEQEKKRAGCPS
jgi:tol-pal system protein YbgF